MQTTYCDLCGALPEEGKQWRRSTRPPYVICSQCDSPAAASLRRQAMDLSFRFHNDPFLLASLILRQQEAR